MDSCVQQLLADRNSIIAMLVDILVAPLRTVQARTRGVLRLRRLGGLHAPLARCLRRWLGDPTDDDAMQRVWNF